MFLLIISLYIYINQCLLYLKLMPQILISSKDLVYILCYVQNPPLFSSFALLLLYNDRCFSFYFLIAEINISS